MGSSPGEGGHHWGNMGQEEEQQQEESPCLAEQLPRPASLSLRERIFRRRTWIIRLAGLLILLGSIIATAVTLGRKETIRMVLLWIHKNQVGGGFIFILLYCWFTGEAASDGPGPLLPPPPSTQLNPAAVQ